MYRIITLIVFIVFGFILQAQDTLTILQKYQLNQKLREKDGRLMFTPVVGPGYTPELGFTFAGGAMLSFKTNKTDSIIQRSSMPIMGGVTSTGAIFLNSKITSFWLADKIRAYGEIVYKDMPDHFWGVGYNDAYNTVQSDTTTAYRRLWWWVNPKILWQYKRNNFIGVNIDVNYTKGSEASTGVQNHEYYKMFNDKPFNAGLGIVYQYDSRDIPVNAWKGMFVEVNATIYGKYLGGNNDYKLLLLDYRKYWQIKRPGQILALQTKARLTTGNVPYGEMSQLGSPFDLRGYTWGRYRHESMFFIIPEYRHTFKKLNGQLSNQGIIFWLATGTLGEKVNEFDSWLPNAGVGYRFEVQPRMNVRFDVGFGKESMGFYFNFNEAF